MADVVIAGAGPAGATLAILLGRSGLGVELYDAHRFPREKPCGEGIMPAGVAVLERLDLRAAVGGRTLASVRYHGFGREAEAPFLTRHGRPVVALAQRRLHLDHVLLATARATPNVSVFEEAHVEGAVLARGRAIGLRVGGDLRRAGLVVGADGSGSAVRRSLGLDRPAPAAGRVGVRMHFKLAVPGPDRLEIFVSRGHELYVAPLPDGELLLAALCPPGGLAGGARAALQRWCAEEPLLAAWLDGATPVTPPAGRAPVARRARAGFAPGAVLLGDAAETRDPLTAGGIAHALCTAELLAASVPQALTEGDRWLARFDRERRSLLRSHGWLTRALVTLMSRPALARATLAGMRAAPRVMTALLRVGGSVDLQPPRKRIATIIPISSAPALPTSNATDQNATLSHREPSL